MSIFKLKSPIIFSESAELCGCAFFKLFTEQNMLLR